METQDTTAKKKRIIIIAAAVLVIATALILFFYYRSKITATTMRILRLEGTVSLEDEGQSKPVRENLRLNSGNALSTEVKSLVAIGLDDVKIVTLDELSRAEFNQSGRKLDLHLTDGSLFFEVQKSLEEDESFEIKTSTMVVGIRGTSGWVSVGGVHESLIVTDGHVHVIGTNPVTGEKKEIDVYAGQRVSTYLYNDRKVDSIMFFVEDITEHDLPEFILERLRENRVLLEKVCKETGWDKLWIMGIVTPTPTPTPAPSDGKSHDSGDDIEPTPVPTEEEPLHEDSKTGGFTKGELERARKMIIAIDASTGIVALSDGTLFDPIWYAEAYPDVVEKYGTALEALIAHYIKAGRKEGRLPLRPVTPTPTPTPNWEQPKNESHDDDDDDDDDSGNKGGSGIPLYTVDPNGNFQIGNFGFKLANGKVTPQNDHSIISSLPIIVEDGTTQYQIDSIDDFILDGNPCTAITVGNQTKIDNGQAIMRNDSSVNNLWTINPKQGTTDYRPGSASPGPQTMREVDWVNSGIGVETWYYETGTGWNKAQFVQKTGQDSYTYGLDYMNQGSYQTGDYDHMKAFIDQYQL